MEKESGVTLYMRTHNKDHIKQKQMTYSGSQNCYKSCVTVSQSLREIWTTKAKASAASRRFLQDFLDNVKALAWLELECDIRFLSG